MNKVKYEKFYKNNICSIFLTDTKKELANIYSRKFQDISPIDHYLKSIISFIDKIIIVLNKITDSKKMYFEDITKISKDIISSFIDNLVNNKNNISERNSINYLQNSFSTSNIRLLNKKPSSFIYTINKINDGSKTINRKSEKKKNHLKNKKCNDNFRNLSHRSKLFSTSNNIKSSILNNFINKPKTSFIKKKYRDSNNLYENILDCRNGTTNLQTEKCKKIVSFNQPNNKYINRKKIGKQELFLDTQLINNNDKSNLSINNKYLTKEDLISEDNPIRKVKNIILKSYSNSSYNKYKNIHLIEILKKDQSHLRNENYDNDSTLRNILANDNNKENSFGNLFGLINEKKYLITEEKELKNKISKNAAISLRNKERDCHQILFDCMKNIKVRLNNSKDKKI